MTTIIDVVNVATTMLGVMAVLMATPRSDCHPGCSTGHLLYASVPAMQVAAVASCGTRSPAAVVVVLLLFTGYPGLLFLCILERRRCESTIMDVSTMCVVAVGMFWVCHWYYILSRRRDEVGETISVCLDPPPPYPPPPPPPPYTVATRTGNNSRAEGGRGDLDTSSRDGCRLTGAPTRHEAAPWIETGRSSESDSRPLPNRPCHTREAP